MVKTILFDVGGTLIYVSPSVGDIYSRVAYKYGQHILPEHLNQRFKVVWKKYSHYKEEHNKEWWKTLVSDVFEPYSFVDKDNFFEELYETFADPTVWKIFPDALLTLKTLREKGFSLAVASNWDYRLPLLLERLDLARYFDHQFISFQLKKSKAHENFFLEVLTTLKQAPSEVIHVGDEEVNDLLAPGKVGIQGFIVNRKAFVKKDFELERLTDLIEKVDIHFNN